MFETVHTITRKNSIIGKGLSNHFEIFITFFNQAPTHRSFAPNDHAYSLR
jgi:hypothetical protein